MNENENECKIDLFGLRMGSYFVKTEEIKAGMSIINTSSVIIQ
jgi:hypothetical protein